MLTTASLIQPLWGNNGKINVKHRRRIENEREMTENNGTYNSDDNAVVSTEPCISMNGA
jgi:hypothetical protein